MGWRFTGPYSHDQIERMLPDVDLMLELKQLELEDESEAAPATTQPARQEGGAR
jgi:hypothetical protein